LPALAFGSHYSVFKERPGTHRSYRWWCRVPEGLFRTDCSAGESPSAVGRTPGGRSDGMHTVSDRPSYRQRVPAPETKQAPEGPPTAFPWVREGGASPRNHEGCRLDSILRPPFYRRTKPHPRIATAGDGRLTVPRQDPVIPRCSCAEIEAYPYRVGRPASPPRTPAVACEEPPGPLARHPAFEAQRAFRSSPIPSPWNRLGERAPLADLLDLPLVYELSEILTEPCCSAVTRA
jgi:hypothetical protein